MDLIIALIALTVIIPIMMGVGTIILGVMFIALFVGAVSSLLPLAIPALFVYLIYRLITKSTRENKAKVAA